MNKRFKSEPYIHYSNVYEDPATLLSCLRNDSRNVLSIASAGDNCLAMLTKDFNRLYIFDRNPAQLALTKLKFAAFAYLKYHEVLILLGIQDGDRIRLYNELRIYLDNETKNYFDRNLEMIGKIRIIHAGRFEYYFQRFSKRILPLAHSKRTIRKFMNLNSTSEQVEFYHRKINNLRFKFFIKKFFSEKTVSKLGRDSDSFKFAKEGTLSKLIIERFLLCIANVLNKENNFLQYAVFNHFDVLPYYLQKENFEKIKKNISKAEFILGDLETIKHLDIKFDFFNLSDIFEYMSKEDLEKNEQLICEMSNARAITVFWNMMVSRSFHNPNFVEIDSHDLYRKEKAYFYQALKIYERKAI